MTFQWNWLRGDFEDPIEVRSFAALKVVLNGEVLTRLYDQIAGGERDTLNVVLYPLALSIAENWHCFMNLASPTRRIAWWRFAIHWIPI
jgi:hypothetical protein